LAPFTRLGARAAVYQSWANTPDRAARTAPAREAYLAKLEAQVDPDGVMTPRDRRKAARAQQMAHLMRASQKAADARRKKAAQ
jgi:hypothetical protein